MNLARSSAARAFIEYAAGVSATLYALVLVYRRARGVQIDFDSAYNLQIARSLAQHFTYAQTYQPTAIYPGAITTNGPMQYLAAVLLLLTHNVDVAAALTACAGTLLLAWGLFRLRPSLAIIPLAFLLTWPLYAALSSDFLGEIWATGFLVHGIACLRKDLRWWAGAAFAAAIATKFLCIVLVPLLLIAWAVPRRAPVAAAAIYAFSAAGFVLQFAFSVLHSNGWTIAGVEPLLSAFVARHVGDGAQANALPFQQIAVGFGQSPALVFVAIVGVAGAILAPATLPLFIATTFLWLVRGLSERELMPFFLVIATLGTLHLAELLDRRRLSRILGETLFAVAAVAVMFLAIQMPNPIPVAPPDDALAYDVQTGVGLFRVSPGFIEAIRHQRYVLTSGWWQLPELSLHWNLTFYDRTWAGAAAFPRARTALLFDRSNHERPLTTVAKNCGEILAVDGPLVLCRPAVATPYAFGA